MRTDPVRPDAARPATGGDPGPVGHLLGLGHVQDNTQGMHRAVRSPPLQQYQSGDLEGLRLVGATQPCYAALRTRSAEEPTTEIIVQ